MPGRVEGRTAIVTGAGGGIGRAASLLLAKEGAHVVVSDFDDALGRETLAAIEAAGDSATYIHCDVTKAGEVKALVAGAEKTFGGLSILVNNAGWEGALLPLVEYEDEDFDRLVAINLKGVYLGIKHGAAAMRLAGNGGAIINIASAAGIIGLAGGGPYVMSKHGVIGLTKSAALELAAENIRVNAVCPAFIRTRMAQEAATQLTQTTVDELGATFHPIGRLGEPDEVAELILWLASDKASFTTGASYTVDGGLTAQ